MMDMMTIILVFLLKNFSSSTQLITQDTNLQVPPSVTKLQAREAVPVTITKRMIIIEGEAVAPVNNGKVDASLKPDGENGYLIQPIVGILSRIANKERRVAEMTGDTFDSELMVVADRSDPLPLADRGPVFLRPGRLLELPAGRPEEQRVAAAGSSEAIK